MHKTLDVPVPTALPSSLTEARLLPGPLYTLFVQARGHLVAHRTLARAARECGGLFGRASAQSVRGGSYLPPRCAAWTRAAAAPAGTATVTVTGDPAKALEWLGAGTGVDTSADATMQVRLGQRRPAPCLRRPEPCHWRRLTCPCFPASPPARPPRSMRMQACRMRMHST